ncbi:MAG: right-handed parallel beta-helix repeat-containing protein [Planctomycetota bacterium]|nr:right-handed parallel beta-helix repeat-containing protein [Planctomycetota bacterium]
MSARRTHIAPSALAEEYSIGLLKRPDKAIVRNCTFTGSPKCAIAARNSELNVYDCGIQLERCVLATFEECEVRFERTEMTLAGDAGTPFINIVKREVTASLTMKDCTVSGPAVAVNNLNSTLNIEGCTFKDCAKAVEAAAGVVHIRDCNLRDCEYGVHIHSGGSAIVETTTFENCTSRAMVLDNTHPTLRDLTFRDCKWGLVLSASQKVEVHNCKFFECNSALGIIGCSVEVSDLRVVGSVGGIKSANSTLKISNTVFDRTEVSVQTKNVQLTVQNSTFKDGASGVNSDGRSSCFHIGLFVHCDEKNCAEDYRGVPEHSWLYLRTQ